MARLFAGRSLRLEDAFRLPRGECCDSLLLHLVGRLSGAGVEHHLAVLLERLPNENDGIMTVRIKTIKQFDNVVQDLHDVEGAVPPALCHGL